MKRFKTWASEAIPRWWVFVLLLLVAVLVEYDNDPAVLEARIENVRLADEGPPTATEDSLAARYAEAWSGWWRMDTELARRIIRIADQEQVPHHVAFGLVALESGFDSLAIGKAGEVGLTQIKPSTARIYDRSVSTSSLKKADKNLELGLRYFHDLIHEFNGDVMLALAAYNMGPTRVRTIRKSGRKVSMNYPNKVLGR